MDTVGRPVALVTGASRGIGAATALALAEHGNDVVITYRNKAARANEVASEVTRRGVRALMGIDTDDETDAICQHGHGYSFQRTSCRCRSGRNREAGLNAAGGLERDLVAADPDYPMRINRDAQLTLVDGALALMPEGGTVIYVTSHWAHLHGQVDYMPGYAPVASTKHAGEQSLRARQQELAERGIRLLVVTGDLIEGTIMAKMMERRAPGLSEERRQESQSGQLPSVTEMGEAIASAAMDTTLPGGYTVVVGGALDTFKRR